VNRESKEEYSKEGVEEMVFSTIAKYEEFGFFLVICKRQVKSKSGMIKRTRTQVSRMQVSPRRASTSHSVRTKL
jgi:hypothetical protein